MQLSSSHIFQVLLYFFATQNTILTHIHSHTHTHTIGLDKEQPSRRSIPEYVRSWQGRFVLAGWGKIKTVLGEVSAYTHTPDDQLERNDWFLFAKMDAAHPILGKRKGPVILLLLCAMMGRIITAYGRKMALQKHISCPQSPIRTQDKCDYLFFFLYYLTINKPNKRALGLWTIFLGQSVGLWARFLGDKNKVFL